MIPKNKEINLEWLSSEINRLFDEYNVSKMNLQPIPPELRGIKAEELIETYFKEHAKMPDSTYLDRLATYMLLDELTDSSPTKARDNEYPILSDRQIYRRKVRETLLSDIHSDNKNNVGRTTKTNYSVIVSQLDIKQENLETEIEFLKTCDELKLDALDILIVWETVFSQETARSLERLTNLKKSAISTRLNRTIEKLKESDLWQKLS